jgi:hypothetical protein
VSGLRILVSAARFASIPNDAAKTMWAEGAVDVSAQISKMNANYAASMLNSGYNSTINQMAAIANMSGPRVKVR